MDNILRVKNSLHHDCEAYSTRSSRKQWVTPQKNNHPQGEAVSTSLTCSIFRHLLTHTYTGIHMHAHTLRTLFRNAGSITRFLKKMKLKPLQEHHQLLCLTLFYGVVLGLVPALPPDKFLSQQKATYWAEDRMQNVFALRSFLIRLPSTFQHFFTFTLLPSSSALLQTPKCSEYHPSYSALFLLPGSSYLEPTPCFCPPFYLCQLF